MFLDNKKQKHQYGYIWWFLIYGALYLVLFFVLENSGGKIHIIHSVLDDYIPFCEYFVIPYLLWFLYIGGALIYFAFIYKNRKEYYRFTVSLCIGMTVFLITSFVYPNGHELRPELTGNSLCINIVRLVYYVDTPTNILPSLHVFESIACCIALWKSEYCNRLSRKIGVFIFTFLIAASTVFMKQHSMIDVCLAMFLNWLCYMICYKWSEKYKDKLILLCN